MNAYKKRELVATREKRSERERRRSERVEKEFRRNERKSGNVEKAGMLGKLLTLTVRYCFM